MNLIKSFFNWIMGWIVMGVIVLVVGFGIKTFSGDADSNSTRSTKETNSLKMKNLLKYVRSIGKMVS